VLDAARCASLGPDSARFLRAMIRAGVRNRHSPTRAHLKIVSEHSSTVLLWARPALKSRSRHPPAAAWCRSPCPARYGTGAGHGRQATRVTPGFIRRVPAPGLQCQVHGGCLSSGTGDRGPSGCCVVLQGQAAPRNRAQPSGAHNPDVHIDKRTIRATLEQMTKRRRPVVPLPSHRPSTVPKTKISRNEPNLGTPSSAWVET